MGYYPIFLQLTGRRCAVIGGGSVAERKVEGLLRAGAEVTVVSPSVSRCLDDWAKAGKVRVERRKFRPGDLAGQDLAFVATDDREVTEAVAREGKAKGVWVNAADDPDHCDFIVPSTVRRGKLVVAVATGGSSPAFSRAVREELEEYLTEDYALLAEIATEMRRELKAAQVAARPEAWRKAFDSELRRLAREGRRKEAKEYLRKRLGLNR